MPTWEPERIAKAKEALLESTASGLSMSKFCAAPGNPSRTTIWSWMNSDPEFLATYKLAEKARAECLVDEIVDIADGRGKADQKKVRIYARLQLAAKIHPVKFSDRVTVADPEGKAMAAPVVTIYIPTNGRD